MRYEVVRWYSTEESEEVTDVLARAVDVDGLFSDPVPVERERVVLRGCPAEFAALAGDYELEVAEGDETQWWDRNLLFQNNAQIGEGFTIDGLPRPWRGHEWPPVTLIGVDDPERIREQTDWRKRGWWCREGLHALDRHGRIMARVPITLEVASVTPSALGDGLFDVVLDQLPTTTPIYWHERPAPSARGVWNLWHQGVPAERNLWARFDADGREAWADLTYRARERYDADRFGGVHHLDGRHVTDAPGLHLALSEAERELFLDVVKLLRQCGNRVELDSELDGIEEIDRIMEFPGLVDRWLHGWVAAAGLRALRHPSAWHVRCDRPGRRIERVLTDDAAANWHATRTGCEDWLTVPTKSPVEVEEIVRKNGLAVRPGETFMRRALAGHPAPPAPDGYTVEVTPGDVIEVRVLHDGAEAASGLIAVVGEDAVPHRIATTPEHRRRGLGSVVMGALAREAVQAGATSGLLFATEDGLHLYRRLGWETVPDVVIAEGKS
ncbi:GNAT family N-acetyltransferase [Lentzea sp. NPDC005914]|uniref:GNAT family N-acetyltransferase n=1 Tax=Lentzea sp. NPDC005914 TaxID=3154572 RepID=UPI0033F0B435